MTNHYTLIQTLIQQKVDKGSRVVIPWLKRPQQIRFVFASVRSPTAEHVNVMAQQLRRLGIEPMLLDFGPSPFSLSDQDPHFGFGNSQRALLSNIKAAQEFFSGNVPTIVLYQSPYPEHYPDWLLEVSRESTQAYAGYGLPLSQWSAGHFSGPIIESCRILVASSRYEHEGYTVEVPEATSLFAGNPLLFELRKCLSLQDTSPPRRSMQQVLWAPHWTRDAGDLPLGFASWEWTVRPIRQWATTSGQALTVRPHPILASALLQSFDGRDLEHREAAKAVQGVSREALAEMRALLRLPNVTLSVNSLVEDVLHHEALVTDGVSILGYWCATGKPILLTRKPLTPRFNAEGEALVALCDSAADQESIRQWLRNAGALPGDAISRDRIALSASIHPTGSNSPMRQMVQLVAG